MIDETRQWFKAETGLGVRETPLDTSLCAHVILENDYVEIPDTLADARMADNPLCFADPGLRFYAGALLKSKGGYPIGTLCVLDNRPRTLNPLQRDALRILADQVMTQLDLRAVIVNEAVLRSEIDHRVKNSLQVVGAFVSLERSASDDDEARPSLERVERQIAIVAALHEHLGIAGITERIDLGPYLDQAVSLIDSTLAGDFSVQGSFENVAVTPREASIVATIVNERDYILLKERNYIPLKRRALQRVGFPMEILEGKFLSPKMTALNWRCSSERGRRGVHSRTADRMARLAPAVR